MLGLVASRAALHFLPGARNEVLSNDWLTLLIINQKRSGKFCWETFETVYTVTAPQCSSVCEMVAAYVKETNKGQLTEYETVDP